MTQEEKMSKKYKQVVQRKGAINSQKKNMKRCST